MSSLDIQVQTEIPRVFIRGQTLDFIMDLPCDVPAEYFGGSAVAPASTIVTTLASQMRRIESAGAAGLIAPLVVAWEDPATHKYTKIRFKCENTDDWPLGPAEFDLVMTRTQTDYNPDNSVAQTLVRKIRSHPVRIEIVDGVTA